jgi:hypothetical protein
VVEVAVWGGVVVVFSVWVVGATSVGSSEAVDEQAASRTVRAKRRAGLVLALTVIRNFLLPYLLV